MMAQEQAVIETQEGAGKVWPEYLTAMRLADYVGRYYGTIREWYEKGVPSGSVCACLAEIRNRSKRRTDALAIAEGALMDFASTAA